MAEIKSDCSKEFFPAYHSSGTRSVKDIKWIIIHDTESGPKSAAAVAKFFKSGSAGGSAHIVVDEIACFRCLNNNQIPWAAPGANSKGFHIEICGFARWSRTEWLAHKTTLRRAAFKTAFHAKLFGIPVKRLFAADLKKGVRGISSHIECTKAFGGSHTDPGPNFPWDFFMSEVRRYYNEL